VPVRDGRRLNRNQLSQARAGFAKPLNEARAREGSRPDGDSLNEARRLVAFRPVRASKGGVESVTIIGYKATRLWGWSRVS